MRRALIAAMAAALFGCSPVFAQVGGIGSPTPGIGTTSPLGVTPGSSVSPAGIPLGATELASPGLSPALTGTIGMAGNGTTCSVMGSASAGASGSSTNFDGGGLGMGTGTPLPGSATTSCGTASGSSASSSTATSSSSPGGVSRAGIPLGSVEIGNGGLSTAPIGAPPVPSLPLSTTSPTPVPSSPVSTTGTLPPVTTVSPTITNVGPRGMSPLPGTQATTNLVQ